MLQYGYFRIKVSRVSGDAYRALQKKKVLSRPPVTTQLAIILMPIQLASTQAATVAKAGAPTAEVATEMVLAQAIEIHLQQIRSQWRKNAYSFRGWRGGGVKKGDWATFVSSG